MRQYLTRQNAGFRGINALLGLLLAHTALAATALTSGADGTDGEPYEQLVHGGWVYLNVTDSKAAPGATDTWYKHQLTLVSA